MVNFDVHFFFFDYPEAPPQRPSKGPAAKIDISLSHDIDELILNGNYPNTSEIMNFNKGHNLSKNIPDKNIPRSELDLIHFSASVLQLQPNGNATSQAVPTTSDLATRQENLASQNSVPEYMDSDSVVLPNISHIGHSSTHPLPNQTNVTQQVFTATSSSTMFDRNNSQQQVQSSQIGLSSELSQNNLPNFSMLNEHIAHSNSSNSSSRDEDDLVPKFSQLNLCHSGTQSSTDQQEFSGYVPQLSALFNQSPSENVVPRA